jgi:hypothetical protein
MKEPGKGFNFIVVLVQFNLTQTLLTLVSSAPAARTLCIVRGQRNLCPLHLGDKAQGTGYH